MNWDDLRIFLAIAREGTLHRAAASLGISQPTAGRRLSALEAALGVPLFSRARTGLTLTTAGTSLRPTAESMEKAAAELARQSDYLQEPAGGTVRISAMEWPAAFLAGRLANAWHHGLAVELVHSELTESFARREADLAVRHGLPLSGKFKTRRIGTMRSAIYGACQFLERNPEARTEQRFTSCDWVLFTEEQGHYRSMRWLDERLDGRRPAARVTTTDLTREAIASGTGLGLLPCYVGDSDPRLGRASAPIEEIAADYWLIVPPENAELQYIRRAIDWVTESFRENRQLLLGSA
ncbi:LysR family transcriptional regulator [Nisaea acidiphila]|uniref:LysR family transcriptional regulator n=1 Tax=Nisaea acidiphila TaxID=1862145 RepID=A0A9J7ARH0_9PROT|nr:LysR family transcriptional regulator [Nisaea acidiphila]UUX49839.1 LysR family transcriptional regulator [Nisaea acidiphila]